MTVAREAVTTKKARAYINTLREYIRFLEDKKAAKETAGRPVGYENAKIEALEWACELGEMEWDAILARRRHDPFATAAHLPEKALGRDR